MSGLISVPYISYVMSYYCWFVLGVIILVYQNHNQMLTVTLMPLSYRVLCIHATIVIALLLVTTNGFPVLISFALVIMCYILVPNRSFAVLSVISKIAWECINFTHRFAIFHSLITITNTSLIYCLLISYALVLSHFLDRSH